MKRRRRRRSAIEPKIGYLKSENRLGRYYLRGLKVDQLNVILAAAGCNLRKLQRALAYALKNWLIFWLSMMFGQRKSPCFAFENTWQYLSTRACSILFGTKAL